MHRWLILLPTVFLVGFKSHDGRLYRGKAQTAEKIEIGLYIEPHQDLNPASLLAGCNLWQREGVHCSLVSNREQAQAVVRMEMDPAESCRQVDVLIVANVRSVKLEDRSHQAEIHFFYPCFSVQRAHSGTRDILPVYMAHEIGHALGLNHVPVDCQNPRASLPKNDAAPYDDQKKMICGQALMNYTPLQQFDDQAGETVADHRAYQVRELKEVMFGPK